MEATGIKGFIRRVRTTIEKLVGEKEWQSLTSRSQHELLSKVFGEAKQEMVRADGSGLKEITFAIYCTIVTRMMVFHCSLEHAKVYPNYALRDAFKVAKTMNGDTLETRMAKAMQQCIADPNWSYNK